MSFSEIEVIEAYKRFDQKKKNIGWSVHVYIPSLSMDLRGVYAKKYNKTNWFVMIPRHINFCEEEKRMISCPVISFTNQKDQEEFNKILKEKIVAFLEIKNLNDNKSK